MRRVAKQVRPDEARAKATAWADAGGPDGKLRPADRERYIGHWTTLFLEMDREEFEDYSMSNAI